MYFIQKITCLSMKPFFAIVFFVALICTGKCLAQKYVVRDIKSFGAKGNGKTNDHLAFQKAAAYFNQRGGNGKLIISKGVYIVGRQTFTGGRINKPAYEGESVLHFTNIKNIKIEGMAGTILKYRDSLRYGAFTPTGKKHFQHGNKPFYNDTYSANVLHCIYFIECSNVSVTNLAMDGNNTGFILGGFWGDVGRQLPHYGIFIKDSRNVIIDKLDIHHFGLDGICVSNKVSLQKDSISISNSSFRYNARQGFSWIGGNHLIVKNCKFNHTGKGVFASPPAAGVDIEAEVGPIRNGYFTNCEFTNNQGVGLLADAGDSGDCTFTNCTFWGTTNWSIWVTKPGFKFIRCNIYGSTTHGYSSTDEKNATKFTGCTFEDKFYNGKPPHGNFLMESNNVKRMSFSDCKFVASSKLLCWVSINPKTKPEEKYQFTSCSFISKNTADAGEI